jgi:periplasmic divalent cation tolerance protein
LMLIKTTTARLAALEKLVLGMHPYDTPEFVALPIHHAAKRYLKWWMRGVSPRRANRKRARAEV